jgi:hypothetical protein
MRSPFIPYVFLFVLNAFEIMLSFRCSSSKSPRYGRYMPPYFTFSFVMARLVSMISEDNFVWPSSRKSAKIGTKKKHKSIIWNSNLCIAFCFVDCPYPVECRQSSPLVQVFLSFSPTLIWEISFPEIFEIRTCRLEVIRITQYEQS